MNSSIVRRLEVARELKRQSQSDVYEHVRLWDDNPGDTKRTIPRGELLGLLKQPIDELGLTSIRKVADHILENGIGLEEAELVVARTTPRSLPSGRIRPNEIAREIAKRSCIEFAMYAGYVAAPAFAKVGRFETMFSLLRRFTRLLGSTPYAEIDGAGSSEQPDLKMMILAPVLGGMCQYYPVTASELRSCREPLAGYMKLMENYRPITECLVLRLACVCIAANVWSPLIQEGHDVANSRYEEKLRDMFAFFIQNRDLMDELVPKHNTATAFK